MMRVFVVILQVAIKCMKRNFASWEECMGLQEVHALVRMSAANHPNIVQLGEVIREKDSRLYFIFEYMPGGNLYEFIKRHTPSNARGGNPPLATISNEKIHSIMSQALNGLAFLHSNGFVHRDIKPENLLLKGDEVKLADFGLVKECACESPLTEYVSTRWYRAPEILLRSKHYGKPVDLFAIGCIMAELYSKNPLFPGDNELDQVSKLVDVLGSPKHTWEFGMKLAQKRGFCVERERKYSLDSRVPSATPKTAISLMKELLQWNPALRPTCAEALQSDFFTTTTTTQKRASHSPSSLLDHPSVPKRQRRDTSPQQAVLAAHQALSDPMNESPRSAVYDSGLVHTQCDPFGFDGMPEAPFNYQT